MKTLSLILLGLLLLFSSASFADSPPAEDFHDDPEMFDYRVEGRSVCIAFIIKEKAFDDQHSFESLYSLLRTEKESMTQHLVFENKKFNPDQAIAAGYWRDKNSIDRKAYLFTEADMCIDGGQLGVAYALRPDAVLNNSSLLYLPADGDCDPGENVCDDYDTSNFYERWPVAPLPREEDDEDSDDSGGCNTTSDDTSKFLSALMLLIGVLALVLGSRRRAAPRD
jgi:MYXO-CTERM domain-containing protein